MDYDGIFGIQVGALKAEGRYRTFANIARRAGSFYSLTSATSSTLSWQPSVPTESMSAIARGASRCPTDRPLSNPDPD